MSHYRKETDELQQKINYLCHLLIKYATARPDQYNMKKIVEEASDFWREQIAERRRKR